jgi:hypothetical protein
MTPFDVIIDVIWRHFMPKLLEKSKIRRFYSHKDHNISIVAGFIPQITDFIGYFYDSDRFALNMTPYAVTIYVIWRHFMPKLLEKRRFSYPKDHNISIFEVTPQITIFLGYFLMIQTTFHSVWHHLTS